MQSKSGLHEDNEVDIVVGRASLKSGKNYVCVKETKSSVTEEMDIVLKMNTLVERHLPFKKASDFSEGKRLLALKEMLMFYLFGQGLQS